VKGLLDPNNCQVGVDRIIALAHRHLGLDVVYVVELTADGPIYRAAAGELSSFKIKVNDAPTWGASYSKRLVAGEIPNLIRDAAAEERVADLPATKEAIVGSYLGVPLRLSDGTLYGTLCGISHVPDDTLDERDVRFMAMLAELIVNDLDAQRRQERLRQDLMRVIEAESITVAYQPIIDLHSDRCLGFEALARFPKPFTRPDVALAAADTVGLRLELERLAISQAWKLIPSLGPGQFLAVNVSPDALVELARRANLRDDLPLEQLVVEVTEHAAVDSYAPLHRQLAPLRRQGMRIAVDDAGAGYASLRHVLELRPDFIKVDRTLIHGIAGDHARRVAVSAFLSLALDIGSSVVAEGVECPADLSVVRELGLHAAQGYLLGRPTTSQDALATWIAVDSQPREAVLLGG
jgi:EAL domain-containing protein (putative c-di-GMP-specific phosphodiesterase class I)